VDHSNIVIRSRCVDSKRKDSKEATSEMKKQCVIYIPDFPPLYEAINPKLNKGKKYVLSIDAEVFSSRYNKFVRLQAGFESDGATGAKDLKKSWSWWFHDILCETCKFADGSQCSARQASVILFDILDAEGRELRKWSWGWMTFLFGSWKIKKRVGWV